MEQQEECCVPPGFRFHPTEEELVGYYLARKVASQKIDLDIIQEVDLYRIEPWDLQERCKYGGGGGGVQEEDEQTSAAEWYFFSYKDRKYPSGTRTNRATAAGFWKATGRDKPVVSSRTSRVIGMRKTLVFYKGRAPNGSKTDWIIHEYRLHNNDLLLAPSAQEEGWVVCRAFQKPIPNQQQRPFFPMGYGGYAPPSTGYYDPPNANARPRLHHIVGQQDHYSNAAAGAGSCFPLHDDLQLESKHRLLSIPQLMETPTTVDVQLQPAAAGYRGDHHQLIQQGQSIDWNFLDTLLSTTSSQLHDSSPSLH